MIKYVYIIVCLFGECFPEKESIYMKRSLLSILAVLVLLAMMCVAFSSCGIQKGDGNHPNTPSDTQIDLTGIAFDGATVKYDGTAKTLVISGTLPDGVSVRYEYRNDADTEKLSDTGVTEIGSYTVHAIFTKSGHAEKTMTAKLLIKDASDFYDPSDGGTYMKDATGVTVKGTDIRIGYNFLLAFDYATRGSSAAVDKNDLSSLKNAADVILAGRNKVPVYGIYAGAAHEYLNFYKDLSEMGVTNLRTNWAEHEVNDEVMAAFCESNISVMLTAGVNLGTYYTGDAQKTNTDPDLWDISKYNFQRYLEAVVDNLAGILNKYGPNGSFFFNEDGSRNYDGNYNPIRYIEVQNEPNFQYLLAVRRPDGSDDAYSFLKHCAYALEQIVSYYTIKYYCPDDAKTGSPTVYVVGMGAGGVNGLDYSFINSVLGINNSTVFQQSSTSTSGVTLYEILNSAIASSTKLQTIMGVDGTTNKVDIDTVSTMDILSTHPYIDGNQATSPFGHNSAFRLSSNIKSIRALLAQKGRADLPIWFTECGWNVLKSNGGLKSDGKHTQLEQAYMQLQFYLYAIRNGIDRVTFMSIVDTDGCNYGQFQTDSNVIGAGASNKRWVDADWRLACYAIQTMSRILPNPSLSKVILETTSGLAYELIPDADSSDRITVVLSPLAPAKVTIPWTVSDYIVMTDIFGAEKIVEAIDGKVTVDAGPNLVYLREATLTDLANHGVRAAETFSILPLAWSGEKFDI